MNVINGPAAVVEGRAALILARVLGGSLRGRLTLRELVSEMRLSPEDQAAVLAAEAALEDVGERWRIAALPHRGNSETRGNEPALASQASTEGAMSSRGAAQIIGRCERRVRQLAAAGDLPALKTPRGWMFDRTDVVDYNNRKAG